MLGRFRREARTIARFTSPNTVRVFDCGVSDSGSPYFVMELLAGMDLYSVVERYGPMPPGRVVSLLRQACRSLAEAHGSGVLHRDIKPQNVFLCRLGIDVDVVKVLDFGLARSLRGDHDHITRDGAVTGTPGYMPPERALGEPADERSDLYALGCVAYFMLTGRPVFEGEPMAVLLQHVRATPARPGSIAPSPIPDRLDEIVMACLAKDPGDRPASAIELSQRLSQVDVHPDWDAEQAEAWWREHQPISVAGRSSDGMDTMQPTVYRPSGPRAAGSWGPNNFSPSVSV